jgi:hypothetical protein
MSNARKKTMRELEQLLLSVAAERGPGATAEDPDCPGIGVLLPQSYMRLEDAAPFLLEAMARGVEQASRIVRKTLKERAAELRELKRKPEVDQGK